MTVDGLIIFASGHEPSETLRRAVAEITARGMTVLARIDHAAAAVSAGLELGPTEVVIFGNAKAGTPLMRSARTIGIDLPLRLLVWRDDAGRTFLAYNDPHWLAARHGPLEGTDGVLDAMTKALRAIAESATGTDNL